MTVTQNLAIIDFHCHHVPTKWSLVAVGALPEKERRRWDAINANLADPGALTAGVDSGDLAARVVNIPTALFTRPEETPQPELFTRVNDRLAEIVHARPGQIHGLASVDAFSDEAGAREAERAVRELGLRGLFVESATGELLLGAPQCRPTLAAAAALGIPVFVHPINPQPLTRQMAPYGRLGTLFARGSINAASLVSLLEGGAFDELPNLRVVVTNLALGTVLLAGGFSGEHGTGRDTAALLRRHVYIDTMGFHPALVRAAVEILGVDHVIVGSDWPIVSSGPIRHDVESTLSLAGLDEAEQRLVAAGNALRLLGLAHKVDGVRPT